MRCTHVDAGRWVKGNQPRGVKPELIATVLSRRLNRPVSPADIAMARLGASLGLEVVFDESATAVLRYVRALASRDIDGDEQVQCAPPR